MQLASTYWKMSLANGLNNFLKFNKIISCMHRQLKIDKCDVSIK